MEGNGCELRIRTDRAGGDELADAVLAAQLEHVRAHHEVRVPVPPRIRAVRADAADLGREMEHELGLRVPEQTLRVVPVRQVVVRASSDEGILAALSQAFDEMRPEEATSTSDDDPHRALG